ncbi:TIGR01777 family oxidoreductase [Sphingobacterium daejeonense]|uniref:TIGR01777 family oxidoreductase n=1 Tax=Sphingobacterium daejeonense TaxID=371142 RepID=UPI0010C37A58|nr:TIGR01777 family oxidoreductase [Sphingobacterium daejeonense]VTP91540.1 Epimerase family protein SA0724 [Sphingobacterium daejeonense]
MAKILIAGGTGLIGQALSKLLKEEGFEVAVLSRSPQENQFYWNPEQNEIEKAAFENTEIIINLAGESVSKTWTKEYKERILNSRVDTVALLLEKAKQYNCKPKAFISSSAAGIYGAVTSDKIFKESDAAGDGFLAEVCKVWEEKIFSFEKLGTRVVALRITTVLSKNGGALSGMLPRTEQGVSTQAGNGKHYVSWIHIDDMCRMFLFAVQNSVSGAFNAVSPEYVTNETFAKTLSEVIGVPVSTPAPPESVLKEALGEMSTLVLNGSRVSSEKIRQAGFVFQFPNLKEALENLVKSEII